MLIFHPIRVNRELTRTHPLYIGNFFTLTGMWWSKRKQRQALILSLAVAWYRSIQRNPSAPGFISEEILITSITSKVKDARVVLEHFFEITRVGFNFNDGNKSPTLVSPRRLSKEMHVCIEELINYVEYAPGPKPAGDSCVKSTVTLQKNRAFFIRGRLRELGREDLLPAVNWLLKQETVDFYYERAGKLGARDKSIWPIKSIEHWPGWLRTELFGAVVDIENAYVQFIVSKLEQKYSSNINRLELKYPDLLKMDRDKSNFRNQICREVLKLQPTDENIKIVKKLMMSLANGSNASPSLLACGSSRSEAVRIVLHSNPDLTPLDLVHAGRRLSVITKQFKAAKKDLCIFMLNAKPTRDNMRSIFRLYLEWERECRYDIWNSCGQTGLMMHDGIDGVVSKRTNVELVQHIAEQTSIRVSVDSTELI